MVSKSLITLSAYVQFFFLIGKLENCILFHITLSQFNQYFFNKLFRKVVYSEQIPVSSRSQAWVSGRSHAGTADSNPVGSMDIFLLWALCVVR